jgi:glyoxylase-like metal-dependent hydrolase (beta-lactamase superfamily II)
MVNVNTLVLGPLQTNCYIVREENASSCVVVDPADSPNAILNFAAREGLSIEAIFLTHGHFDHVGAVETLLKKTGCAVWMHKGDYSRPGDPMNDYLYPLHDKDIGEISFCDEGTAITSAGLTFTVHSTPGHSLGSVCYQTEGVLLSGDTLFAGGCGRTDLPGGSADAIFISLADLSELEGDIKVYPGHGESTTLAREKRYNPYMR